MALVLKGVVHPMPEALCDRPANVPSHPPAAALGRPVGVWSVTANHDRIRARAA